MQQNLVEIDKSNNYSSMPVHTNLADRNDKIRQSATKNNNIMHLDSLMNF
jgi:hypothetical protein